MIRCHWSLVAVLLAVWCLVASLAAQPVAAEDEAAPSSEPPQTVPEVQEAVNLLKAGQRDKSLEKLKEASAKHPELPEPQAILGQIYLAFNQVPLGRLELERAVALDPAAPEPYVIFAELALREGRVTDAECLLNRAMQACQSFGGNAQRKADGLKRGEADLAAVAETRSEWQTALDHLTACKKLEPKNAVIDQRIGRVLFQLKKYKEAYASLQAAVKEDKRMVAAEAMMGQLYERAGDHKTATNWMTQAAKNAPDDMKTRVVICEWAIHTNEIARAKVEAEALAKLDPDAVETHLLRGSIARAEHKLPEAEKHFEMVHLKALETSPRPTAWRWSWRKSPNPTNSVPRSNLRRSMHRRMTRIPTPWPRWPGFTFDSDASRTPTRSWNGCPCGH